ncbi:Hypothetical protein (plasmid) [Pseudomonas putida]|nr:Hypothetical protein [Pseudomonas putida]
MWLIKVWDGYSTNWYHSRGTYDEVTRSLRNSPPGYIWSAQPA